MLWNDFSGQGCWGVFWGVGGGVGGVGSNGMFANVSKSVEWTRWQNSSDLMKIRMLKDNYYEGVIFWGGIEDLNRQTRTWV